MKTDELLRNLSNVRRNSNGWLALCPAHDDRKQSLSIRETDGRILLKCFAACDVKNIVAALNLEMEDLFGESKKTMSNNHNQSKKIVAVYPYADENGALLYENIRFEPKDFRQRRFDKNNKEIWNLNDVRRVPYRLPELLEGVKQSAEIWLCEGEKDADRLRELGLTASSFKNWTREYNSYLKTAHVCLFQDHDRAGMKQARDAAQILSGSVASLKIINLYAGEPLPEKHGRDVSDYIAACESENSSADEISERLCIFADNTDLWQPDDERETAAEVNENNETPVESKTFPTPREECFYGLAGEYVRFIEPHTEADRMALLIQFLAYFGNIIGRSAFFQVEGNQHYTNLFCVLVGDTASGRKGTSFGRVREVYKDLDAHHQSECIVSGLASGEGLLYHVRDAQYIQKKNTRTGKAEDILADGGVTDKRLLVVEGEFAQVLRVQGREGNSLSAIIRSFWDSGNARNLTKNSPLKTTDAHVSIVGHITKTELINCLSEVESANGYANRFLWICVRRSKFLPFGSDIGLTDLMNINADIASRIKLARDIREIRFSNAAKDLWISSYRHLETSRFGFVAKVTQRASPYVLRLSCIFAVLDAQTEIRREHLEAALAVWQFCEDSAKYIFGEKIGSKNADTLLAALRQTENGLTRTEIHNDIFRKNLNAGEIKSALQILVDADLIESQTQPSENSRKPSEKWFAKSSALRI